MVIVRSDLALERGQEASTVSRASMKVFLSRGRDSLKLGILIPLTDEMRAWLQGDSPMDVVYVQSEADLIRMQRLAWQAELPCALIQESNRTRAFYTALAIGPCADENLDPIMRML